MNKLDHSLVVLNHSGAHKRDHDNTFSIETHEIHYQGWRDSGLGKVGKLQAQFSSIFGMGQENRDLTS